MTGIKAVTYRFIYHRKIDYYVKKNKENSKLAKINELRNKLKPYGTRPPYDLLKEVEADCKEHKIDDWLVKCPKEHFETVLRKGNINEF